MEEYESKIMNGKVSWSYIHPFMIRAILRYTFHDMHLGVFQSDILYNTIDTTVPKVTSLQPILPSLLRPSLHHHVPPT